jgi:hypothetical protein
VGHGRPRAILEKFFAPAATSAPAWESSSSDDAGALNRGIHRADGAIRIRSDEFGIASDQALNVALVR